MMEIDWGLYHMWHAYDVIMIRLIELHMEFQLFDVLPDILEGGLC